MVVRCTKRMLDLLGSRSVTLSELPPTDDDWCLNLLWIDRQKCLLLTHAGTLFSVFRVGVHSADIRPIGNYLVAAIAQAASADATSTYSTTDSIARYETAANTSARSNSSPNGSPHTPSRYNRRARHAETHGGWRQPDPTARVCEPYGIGHRSTSPQRRTLAPAGPTEARGCRKPRTADCVAASEASAAPRKRAPSERCSQLISADAKRISHNGLVCTTPSFVRPFLLEASRS